MGLSQSELTNAPMAQIMVAVPCFCWTRTAGGICGGAVSAMIVGGMGAKQFDYPSRGGRASYHFHKILFIKPNTINIWLAVLPTRIVRLGHCCRSNFEPISSRKANGVQYLCDTCILYWSISDYYQSHELTARGNNSVNTIDITGTGRRTFWWVRSGKRRIWTILASFA